jgi:hypothetical protein
LAEVPAERPEGALTHQQQEQRILQLRAQATIPILEVIAEEVAMRAKDGTLAQEMHGMNAGKLIGNLTKILTALQNRGPVIVVPSPAAGDAKDPSFYRAHSASNLTEKEREARRKAVDAEIVE